jgi:hypothetical protein
METGKLSAHWFTPGSQQFNLYGITSHAAGAWVKVAATLSNGTLTLYENGTAVASRSGLTPPVAWSATDKDSGFELLGKHGGGGSAAWTISDIRVSRKARTPGVARTVAAENTVTFTDTAAGTVKQELRGGLHQYGSYQLGTINVPSVEAQAVPFVKVGRTDKFLSCTPIKAGAPDTDHPTLGHSGAYSYDWRPLDRQQEYYKRLGITPLLEFGSTPQILGGAAAPFTPAQAADVNRLPSASSYNKQVPTDFAAFATICADMFHYVTVTRGDVVPRWSVWNEPDGGTNYWLGTQTQWFQLYAATVAALRAISPTVQVGGGDFVDAFNGNWVQNMMSYCGANAVPLDFISYHQYNGDFV